MKYTIDDFARLIDHTNLHADATEEDMKKLCDEAKKYHFKMVAINEVQSEFCAQQLKGTDIDTGAAISFPLGQTTITCKLAETKDALQNGANEIDYVVNLTQVRAHNWSYIEDEMTQMVKLCRDHHVPCKVIFETCYLTKAEIKQLALIAKKVKPDFVKTSTGFGTAGAKVEDVKLMKENVGPDVKVKAAGGIRNTDDFLAMIAAGAERIGTSSGVKIIETLKQRFEKDGINAIEI
ncbi:MULTISPECIES: deoxyribose-phosphate aldolase [unclassified Lactobacillus]|uniref:deoxyribose-phosphate aldolase n=1 Tax=unclassified Lactobacillus TaxID=2620435 RepID=UPI0018DC3E99|nr:MULTISPECIES: deoxyribose-phosphate aldolase [unclassified Lactobacillus]MBH9988982.1 deoxyribose-phosphate aldolase [Lactobacillus sp. M0392]MBI0023399.1 deoxyribose-phosphate aldolase [Lactobacillus sp. W8171]MBI0043804.1 deoxyribose-phosphate aldolase [Lactobacillus sp. M0393]UZN42184.1 deoxyribose-phosphate aldolase [Lactobacillus sp. IBH004]